MKIVVCIAALVFLGGAATLKDRIAHNDPAKYRDAPHAHGGAGTLRFDKFLNRPPVKTNFLFLHAATLDPKAGIGHHFHHRTEEMYVILDNEAEFTINGRTSRLKGPVAVPCKAGQSHAIYNPTNKPTRFLNFAVAPEKRKYDAFDLGDDRVGVNLDPKPVFVHMYFDPARLEEKRGYYGGKGAVKYRRGVGPAVFQTNWSYVDHVLIPPGASSGARKHERVEEVFYVMKGSGELKVDGQTATLKAGDAIVILLGETQSLINDGNVDLELIVVGVAAVKGDLDPAGF